jgi:predicted membrane channel-forming protein YqfA (hemolysin III family)
MKKRFKNWITTIIGIVIMLLAVTRIVINIFFEGDHAFWTTLLIIVLGWVFLSAKDTLLEGLFMKLFKIPPTKEED